MVENIYVRYGDLEISSLSMLFPLVITHLEW